jgi:hypothetical protein
MATENEVGQRFLRLLTFLFDVPLIALLASLIIFRKIKDFKAIIIFLTFFTIIPISEWFYFVKVKDYPKYRKFSFLVNMVSYTIGVFFLIFFKSNKVYTAIGLSYFLSGFFLAVVNKLGYKISGHAAGIAGPGTAIGIVYGAVGYLFLLLLVPAGFAKIKIKDHTFMQFALGTVVTILVTYLSFHIVGAI